MPDEPNDPMLRVMADTIVNWCDGDAGRPVINRQMALLLTAELAAAMRVERLRLHPPVQWGTPTPLKIDRTMPPK